MCACVCTTPPIIYIYIYMCVRGTSKDTETNIIGNGTEPNNQNV